MPSPAPESAAIVSPDVQKLAAFTLAGGGGNPAGVVLLDQFPEDALMQGLAADIGFSETAFAKKNGDGWRVRYFAPEQEVPFCGHATIALGAALGARFGAGTYSLSLNDAQITVEATQGEDGAWGAALQSPETWSQPLPDALETSLMTHFKLTPGDLHDALPTRLAFAGAKHAILPLARRDTLAAMDYDYDATRALMLAHDVTTIDLVWPETCQRFHARNPFPVGGIYEDPATGAAAAAFAGMVRDIGWHGLSPEGTRIEIIQGEDMGRASRIEVDIPPRPGSSVRVSGATARL